MFLLRNATVYAPEARGLNDILIGDDRILWMGPRLDALPSALLVEEIDLAGAVVVPGLVDGHAHLTGGGGEAGPHTRVPPPPLTQYTKAGVTSVVGVLGTDDVTRTTGELVVSARGLEADGLSAWCHTGGYHFPLVTLTGSIRGDITHIDRIIGVGEVAISDHRSSQPTLDELLRVAADAHVGGLMTGKAGILHLHVGDGLRGLDLIRRALTTSEIPPRVFNPTHVNRRRGLFEEALLLARADCVVDITSFDVAPDEDAWSAADALERYLASGAPLANVTVSSDGGGCLPVFDQDGRVVQMGVGHAGSLMSTVRDLLSRGMTLDEVLPAFTSNVAALLRLPRKGRVAIGMDADLVVLDAAYQVRDVMARGAWHVRGGTAVRRGAFES
ncbi:MAG: beta-aspartyl-peptidase [Gemmatimonadota bacterium]